MDGFSLLMEDPNGNKRRVERRKKMDHGKLIYLPWFSVLYLGYYRVRCLGFGFWVYNQPVMFERREYMLLLCQSKQRQRKAPCLVPACLAWRVMAIGYVSG